MTKATKHLYEFGPFLLDPAEHRLLRDGKPVPLTPKSFDTLLVLVRHPGRLLEKDELMKELWPDTFVEEGNLAFNISKLRKALGEDQSEQCYIETVAKIGYRFVARVKELTTDGVEESEASPARAPAEPMRGGSAQRSGQRLPICSLAVLPLVCLSSNPEEQFFADGMTDALITTLAQISALRVISRTSAIQYKGARKSLPEIARELKVDAVLEGTVLRSRNRVRIAGQLIDARTDTHLWAKKYESDLRDILALQSDVAQAIAQEIEIKLTPQEQARLALTRPVDPEAYEAFLKGRYSLNRRNPDALREGLRFFQQSVDKDPGYALGYVGVADSYTVLASAAYDAMPPCEGMPKAKAAALKALELDPGLGEAHASLAQVLSAYDWDFSGAERRFQHSIELNPGYPSGYHFYAVHLMAMDRQEEAIAEERRALELDPLSPIFRHNMARALHYAHRDDEAIAEERIILGMTPNFYHAHNLLGWLLLGKGQTEEALTEFREALDLSWGALIPLANLGYAQGATGNRAEAEKTLERLIELSTKRYIPAYYFAIVYAGLGERDQAFTWLEKGYQERSNYLLFLKVIESVVPLRSDPRLQELIRRVGLPG